MESTFWLLLGTCLGFILALIMAYIGYNFGRAILKQIELPPLAPNGILRKAFAAGGKLKPKINDDEKAFKSELERKKRGE